MAQFVRRRKGPQRPQPCRRRASAPASRRLRGLTRACCHCPCYRRSEGRGSRPQPLARPRENELLCFEVWKNGKSLALAGVREFSLWPPQRRRNGTALRRQRTLSALGRRGLRAQRAGVVGARRERDLSVERRLSRPVASATGPLPLPALRRFARRGTSRCSCLLETGPSCMRPHCPRGRLDVPRTSADSRLLVVVDVLTEFERLVCSGGDR
jgi:hypothetical protein